MITRCTTSLKISTSTTPLIIFRPVAIALGALLLNACGGGGGGSGGSVSVTAGTYQPSVNFAARCASPRSGTDPFTNVAYPDQQGTTTNENNWLRSWTHETYLWYREVPDASPSSYTSPLAYFDVLKTTQKTASGQDKDKFHFTYPTAVWEALALTGVQAGYGATWAILESYAPRDVRVAYTEPNSPATGGTANLARGAKLLAIDGIDVVNTNSSANVAAINAALFPAASGESHTFTVLDNGSSTQRAFTMTSANITGTPVQNVQVINTGSDLVGYLLFNDHIATSEQQLISAVTTLANAGISDLVLDIRYNGGGYLDIASELAYMIAGPTATSGKTFEALQFNDQHTTTNAVTGAPLTPTPFHSTSQGFSVAAGQALPVLNLPIPRVFVLTGSDTCSASEAIINSLRGIDIEVIQIGSTTCGKPYGFYPTDNCGTTYFAIQFKGVNAKGFGDYSDGFAPSNTVGVQTTTVPGCSVGDDFTHALGNVAEARLAAALNYRNTQGCPTPSGYSPRTLRQTSAAGMELPIVRKSPWHENRILR